jgi:hypothetical protein
LALHAQVPESTYIGTVPLDVSANSAPWVF